MTRRAVPVRTCVGCRERSAKSDLLRIVAEPPNAAGASGILIPDPRGRMPGRGAHLHLDPECLALAERRRAFGRALRTEGPFDATAVQAWIEAQRARQEAQHHDRVNPERADLSAERSMSQHR